MAFKGPPQNKHIMTRKCVNKQTLSLCQQYSYIPISYTIMSDVATCICRSLKVMYVPKYAAYLHLAVVDY